MAVNYTPTQQRVMEMLGDGEPHKSRDIIKRCLNDELVNHDGLRVHMHYLRKKLRPQGIDILCVWHNRAFHYRMIRLLIQPTDDREGTAN